MYKLASKIPGLERELALIGVAHALKGSAEGKCNRLFIVKLLLLISCDNYRNGSGYLYLLETNEYSVRAIFSTYVFFLQK